MTSPIADPTTDDTFQADMHHYAWVTRLARECASQKPSARGRDGTFADSMGSFKQRALDAVETLRMYDADKDIIERELRAFVYDHMVSEVEWSRSGPSECNVQSSLGAGIGRLTELEKLLDQMQKDLPAGLATLRSTIESMTALKAEYDNLGGDKK